MPPALAARIRARVRGRKAGKLDPSSERQRLRVVAFTRAAGLVVVGLFLVLSFHRRTAAESALEQRRAAILEMVRATTASLTERDLGSEARIETWLTRGCDTYETDFVADRLRAPSRLADILDQGSVYVRGAEADLRTRDGIRAAAATSVKDAFLACLLAPPKTRSETALMSRVYDVYAGGAERQTAQVATLHELQAGLPFLLPAWREQVEQAQTFDALDGLRRTFERAPVPAATHGATAKLLVFAIDEPPDSASPAELDGERAHAVRVGLVDLSTDALLLRLRRRVDPSAISSAKRPLYASGIDGCALAFDVRDTLRRMN